MKKFIFFIVFLLIVISGFLACKKERDTNGANLPPVANAGRDTIIASSIATLDGSASTDPDGFISSIKWTKITGPSSYNIRNANTGKTEVTSLVKGTYQFELKVTDNGGLFSKDTVQVTVVNSLNVCSGDSVAVISGTGALIPIGKLSQAKYVQAAAAGDKLVFAGGIVPEDVANGTTTASVDIYNLTTHTWSTTTLTQPRNGLQTVTVGNKILFASTDDEGDIRHTAIDIYDAATDTWSAPSLTPPFPLLDFDAAMVGTNNKVFIADGYRQFSSGVSNKVDIYDAVTNTWSAAKLSEARYGISAVALDNEVFFAGGYKAFAGMDEIPTDLSKRVDIYHTATNSWMTAELSVPRYGISVATLGNKVLFAGGITDSGSPGVNTASARVDIYDATTHTWTTATLSEARGYMKAVTIGNKVLFAGGNSNRVDIYDAASNTWSTATLATSAQSVFVTSTAVMGNKVLFLMDDGEWINIYDAATNTWTSAKLNKALISFAVTAGNEIFIGGGIIGDSIGSSNSHYTCQVWKFQF